MAAHQELNELKLRIGVRTKLEGAVKPFIPITREDEAERRVS
jgi:hypothetical protein